MEKSEELARILTWDPGERGLLGKLPLADLNAMVDEMIDAQKVMILTGFPVAAAEVGETDGPVGAAHIAHGLTQLGKEVTVITDRWSLPLVEAACRHRAPAASCRCVEQERAREDCEKLLSEKPDLVIAIERPGKGEDGHYHNMRGQVIDHLVADTDLLLEKAPRSIAIGDGGNELGMGTFSRQIRESVPHGETICAKVGADHALASGVSNWWGWGVEALLSCRTGQWLLPDDEQEKQLLSQVVEAGGVDGVTGKRQSSVDGLSLDENLQVLRRLRQAIQPVQAAL